MPLLRRFRPLTLVLFFFSAFYLFTASGIVDSVDASPSLLTAEAILTRHSLRVFPTFGLGPFFSPAPDGNGWYTKMGFTYPVLYLPAVYLSNLSPIKEWHLEKEVHHFIASLVNPLLGIFLIGLFFQYLIREGLKPPKAFFYCCLLGIGSLLFPYIKSSFREPALALALFGTFYFFSVSHPTARQLFWGSCFFLFGFFTKVAFVVPALPLLALAAWQIRKSKKRQARHWSALLVPLAMGAILWMTLAHQLYGGILQTGYSHRVMNPLSTNSLWKTPLAKGIFEQLFSLEYGILFYSPGILLALWGILRWIRQRPKWDAKEAAILASFALNLALYAKWTSPFGHEGLGPRYLVAVLPLVMTFVHFLPVTKRSHRIAILAISLLSFTQLIPLSCVKFSQYWVLRSQLPELRSVPHWKADWVIFANKLRNQPEIYTAQMFGGKSNTPVAMNATTLQGFNFWWVRVLERGQSTFSTERSRGSPDETIQDG